MKLNIQVSSIVAISLFSLVLNAQVAPLDIKIAQDKANKVFPFNRMISNGLFGDTIVAGGIAKRCDIKGAHCKPAHYIQHTTHEDVVGSLYSDSALSTIIQLCIYKQAGEIQKLAKLVPSSKKFFKFLVLNSSENINVYESHDPAKPTEKTSLDSLEMAGLTYWGDPKRPLLKSEDILEFDMTLRLYLDQLDACTVVTAKELKKALKDSKIYLSGYSEVN